MKHPLTVSIVTKGVVFFAASLLSTGLYAQGGHGGHGGGGGSVPRPTGSYRLAVKTSPSTAVAGKRVTLRLTVKDAKGKTVRRFKTLHQRKMHLIIVSSDLKEFYHEHPTQASDGFKLTWKPRRAVAYDLIAEFQPAGASAPATARATLKPKGAKSPGARLASDRSGGNSTNGYKTEVAGTSVTLANPSEARAGAEAHLRFAIGAPRSEMKNWLGMPGHAIVFSQDRKTFLHLHGHWMQASGEGGSGGGGHEGHAGPVASTGGPELLGFQGKFPRAGWYKIWVQFKRKSRLIAAPFVLDVP